MSKNFVAVLSAIVLTTLLLVFANGCDYNVGENEIVVETIPTITTVSIPETTTTTTESTTTTVETTTTETTTTWVEFVTTTTEYTTNTVETTIPETTTITTTETTIVEVVLEEAPEYIPETEEETIVFEIPLVEEEEEYSYNLTRNWTVNQMTYYSGSYGCYGASGRTLVNNYSVACNSIPLGTIVHIESDDGSVNGDYRVDDTGGMGDNIIDIFYSDYSNVPYPFSRDGRVSCVVWIVE